jgi:hypothetical protein
MSSARFTAEVLATRGERLSLRRVLWSGAGSAVGPSEIEFLQVDEVDADGNFVANVTLDLDDLEAAYAELDGRFATGEAAAHARTWEVSVRIWRAIAARDWERLASGCAPDLTVEDHRPLRLLATRTRDEYLASVRTLVDLRADATIRADHVLALGDRRLLAIVRWLGGEPEGTFEIPIVIAIECAPEGIWRRIHTFDLDQLDEARECLATIGGAGHAGKAEAVPLDTLSTNDDLAALDGAAMRPDPLRIPPNAATRASDRMHEAGKAQDWEAIRVLCASTLEFDDRRHGLRTTGDRELYLANLRHIFSRATRATLTLLATSGDRLALTRDRWTQADDQPAFEIETLALTEADAEGRIVARLLFDPDDRRAASAEMLERYARHDEARDVPPELFEALRALNAHDLDRLRAALPRDYVYEDHRRTGIGRLESAEAYLTSIAPVFELSPDAILEFLYTVATEPHGSLVMAHSFGTLANGGTWESAYAVLSRYEGGRFVGLEMFEPEDLDVARARFEELRPDPLLIPRNAASRVRDRIQEAYDASDWPALRALVSPDFTYDDRRVWTQLAGDAEFWIKSMRTTRAGGARLERELIGTFGERIALERFLWHGEPDRRPFEVELVALTEIDAHGRLRASISLDLDDRRAAFAEAQTRFAAGEAAAIGGQEPIAVFECAFARRDWAALRESLAPSVHVQDCRTPSLGVFHRDGYVESLRTLVNLAPDVRRETFRILAWNRHGRVALSRRCGTVPDGGPFENVVVGVFLTAGDHIQRYETFDVGDADHALARFAEACAERAR